MNGAYYGPPVPPPRAYRRRSSGVDCCCICNPLLCCCKCMFGCLVDYVLQILCLVLVLVIIISIIIWVLFEPHKVIFNVNDAALTQFEFSPPTNVLNYDLALNITIKNPNARLGIEYYNVVVGAFYENVQFSNITLDPFFQGIGSISSLHPVFRGRSTVVLGNVEVNNYFKDKNSGIYEIDVKLYLRIEFKSLFVLIKSPKFKPIIDCYLKIPLNADGKSSGTFLPTECGFDW